MKKFCIITMLFLLGYANSYAEENVQHYVPTDEYSLPYEQNQGSYDDIVSISASSTRGELTVSIKNTGKKDIILRNTGVHIRLFRTPIYALQGKKKIIFPVPSKLKIAAGQELQFSFPSQHIKSNVVHIGFVSLVIIGEKVYDFLPERTIPIHYTNDMKR